MSDRKLSHFDEQGNAHMVEVGGKKESLREAVASGVVRMRRETAVAIKNGNVGKGDVLGIARIAGIQGVKRTAELIPLCHPLRISGVDIELTVVEGDPSHLEIRATVRAFDRTGVEMEALTAVSVAALTVYDMCKSIEKGMTICEIRLLSKSGGKSGLWEAEA